MGVNFSIWIHFLCWVLAHSHPFMFFLSLSSLLCFLFMSLGMGMREKNYDFTNGIDDVSARNSIATDWLCATGNVGQSLRCRLFECVPPWNAPANVLCSSWVNGPLHFRQHSVIVGGLLTFFLLFSIRFDCSSSSLELIYGIVVLRPPGTVMQISIAY